MILKKSSVLVAGPGSLRVKRLGGISGWFETFYVLASSKKVEAGALVNYKEIRLPPLFRGRPGALGGQAPKKTGSWPGRRGSLEEMMPCG